jgi:hypothetical protein
MGLVAREFWLSGHLVNAVCAVFIEDDLGDVWKLFLDDEDYTWKVEHEHEARRPGVVEGDDEFRYPTTDLLNRFGVRGHVIRRFSETDLGVLARAKVEFSTGQALVHDYTVR